MLELQQVSNNCIQVGNEEPETMFVYLMNHHDITSYASVEVVNTIEFRHFYKYV